MLYLPMLAQVQQGAFFRSQHGTHRGKETKCEDTQQACFAASTVTNDDEFPGRSATSEKIGRNEGAFRRHLRSGTAVPRSVSWEAYLRMTFWELPSFAMAGKRTGERRVARVLLSCAVSIRKGGNRWRSIWTDVGR